MLPETGKEEAIIVCERIRKSVAMTTMVDEKANAVGTISVTIGLAAFPEDADNKDDLYSQRGQGALPGEAGGQKLHFPLRCRRERRAGERRRLS